MMTFPWVFIAKNFGVDLADFPAVVAWRETVKARPAERRAIELPERPSVRQDCQRHR